MDRIDLMVAMIDKLTGPAMKMGRSLNTLKSRVAGLGAMASRMNAKIAGVAAAVQAGFANSVFGRAARSVMAFKDTASAALAITGLRVKAAAGRVAARLSEMGQAAGAAAGITGLRLKQGLGKAAGHVSSFASDVGTAFKRSQIGQALGAPLARMGGQIRSFAGAASSKLQAFAARGKATFQAFAGRAGSSIAQFAAKAQMNIGLAGLKIQSAMQKAGSAVSAFASRAVPHLKNVGQKFLDTAKNALFMGGVFGGVLGAGVVAATVKMADFGQRSRAALDMLTGGADQGAAAMRMIEKTIEDLALDTVQTTEDFQRLIGIGFSAGQANELVQMGADMTAFGIKTEKVTSVLDAMGKIQATGSLQGDELMMLAEAGVNIGKVYEKLGQKFGKTKKQIIKMKEAGEISSDAAIAAIKEVQLATMGKTKFGEARTDILEKTIGGSFDRIKSKIQGIFKDIGKAAAPKLAKTLGAVFDALTKGLAGGGRDNFIFTIVEGVGKLADVVEQSIPFVKAFAGGLVDGFNEAWPAIKGALAELAKGLGSGETWLETTKALGTEIGKLAAALIGIAAILGGEVGVGLKGVIWLIQGIGTAWGAVIKTLGAVIFWFEDMYLTGQAKFEQFKTQVSGFGAAIIQGLVNGIQNGLSWIAEAARSIGATLLGGIKSALGIASPSKETMWAGQMVTSGFMKGIAPLDGLNPIGGVAAGNDNAVPFGERPMMGPSSGVGAGAQAGAAVASAGGGGGGTANITVNVHLDNPPDDPKATAQELKRISLAELAPAFEELMRETGSG